VCSGKTRHVANIIPRIMASLDHGCISFHGVKR
jgi:hypothetical protein